MEAQKVIGIVGGGQLGRMLTLAALPLGFKVVVIDPGENCPASQAGAEQIKSSLHDREALHKLAELSDFITIEIEHIDADILNTISKSGKPVNPSPGTIKLIQDKYQQKLFLQKNGLPVAKSRVVKNRIDASEILKELGGSILLKTRRNAYDGRGNARINSNKELKSALEKFGEQELYAEEVVPFIKELAVMVARDVKGNIASYPVVETIHERNICIEVLAPAPIDESVTIKAVAAAEKAISHLEGAGIFGVEMFLTKDGEILINEIAPRVHNSGHYTMDACETSQFEQHVRAITGLPLGKTGLTVPAAAMFNILGEHDRPTVIKGLQDALSNAAVHVHLYGKSPTKIDRKMGHINAVGKNIDDVREAVRQARLQLEI